MIAKKHIVMALACLLMANASHAIELVNVSKDGYGGTKHPILTLPTTDFIYPVSATHRASHANTGRLSADGRYIVFASSDLELTPLPEEAYPLNDYFTPGTNNGNTWGSLVYLRDLQTRETTMISVPNPGIDYDQDGNFDQMINHKSYADSPSISDDGRYIAFESNAKNLVKEDTRGGRNIFYYDRVTKETKLVSKSLKESPETMLSYSPSISGDGKYIVYTSYRKDLTTDDIPGGQHIYLYSIEKGTNTLISRAGDGLDASITYYSSYKASISYDGRYVMFKSTFYNFVPGTRGINVYVRDTVNHTTKLISKKPGTGEAVMGIEAGTYLLKPTILSHNDYEEESDNAISNDGCLIVYHSSSYVPLVENDTNNRVSDIFLHNQCTDETIKITGNGVDGNTGNADSALPSISNNGRYVAFRSAASNLVADDTNDALDIFVYDRETTEIKRVNLDENGNQAESGSVSGYPTDVSDEGHVVFASSANNLMPATFGPSAGGINLYISGRSNNVGRPRPPVDGEVLPEGGIEETENGSGSIPDGETDNATGSGNGTDPELGSGNGSTTENGSGSGPDGETDNATGSGNGTEIESGSGGGSTTENGSGSSPDGETDNVTGNGNGNGTEIESGSGGGSTTENGSGSGSGGTTENGSGANPDGGSSSPENGSGGSNGHLNEALENDIRSIPSSNFTMLSLLVALLSLFVWQKDLG